MIQIDYGKSAVTFSSKNEQQKSNMNINIILSIAIQIKVTEEVLPIIGRNSKCSE